MNMIKLFCLNKNHIYYKDIIQNLMLLKKVWDFKNKEKLICKNKIIYKLKQNKMFKSNYYKYNNYYYKNLFKIKFININIII